MKTDPRVSNRDMSGLMERGVDMELTWSLMKSEARSWSNTHLDAAGAWKDVLAVFAPGDERGRGTYQL